MGNDGGTIARGQDLRAVYDSVGKADLLVLDDKEKALFNTCALLSLPLYVDGVGEKVVSDYHGKIYLKEKVLEALLEKKLGKPAKLDHINGLGDVIDLKIKWDDQGRIVCPVTGTSKSSHSNLAYLRPCGCVFSNKLLTESRKHFKIPEDEPDSTTSECPLCGEPFTFNYDVVILNPHGSKEVESFNERNFIHLQLLHMNHSKKSKKRKKKQDGNGDGKVKDDGKVTKKTRKLPK